MIKTVALEKIFHTEEGEFVAIMGPSGCGKSKLRKGIIGLVFQSFNLIDELNKEGTTILMVTETII